MDFSPYVLLRLPTYDLTHLDVFALNVEDYNSIEEAMEDKRKHFLSFINAQDLLLSLPFSSKMVYQAIPHYEFHAAVKIRKKEKQTERALMKYLSRMSLNPSPLAAFAKSQFVDWDWNTKEPSNKFSLSLSLTQRKEFFDLCYCDIGLQKYMRYRLNPSLRKQAQEFTYLHIEGDQENRIVLEFDQQFEDMFNLLKKTDFTLEQFVEKTDYNVNDFLEAQLIVPSYPIYTDHDFVVSILQDINERLDLSFKVEDVIGFRKDVLTDQEAIAHQKHWESQISVYAKKLEVHLDHKLYSERIYYLNAYSEEAIEKPSFDKELVSQEVLSLVALANEISNQEKILPLSWDTVFNLPNYTEPSFDVSDLSITQNSEFVLHLNLDRQETITNCNSLGIMLRFSDAELPSLVNVSTPYGKFFAPAIELAAESVNNDLKQWVNQSAQNIINLKDASLHNKNRAHGFIPELNNFGLDFHTPIEDRISLDFNESGNIVNDDTKEIVSLVNLGIENYNTRSAFYQNVYRHTARLPNFPVLIEAIQNDNMVKMDEHVRSAPRINSNYLILAYRKWFCSKETFTFFQDTKNTHLDRLNEWRKQYQIPRIVEYSIDHGKSFFLDFLNPWSVDSFLKLIRKMEETCTLVDMGCQEKIKGNRLYEAYYEIKI